MGFLPGSYFVNIQSYYSKFGFIILSPVVHEPEMLLCRSSKQVQQLNKSVWNVNSAISSSSLLDSTHTLLGMVQIFQPLDLLSYTWELD